jgi:hypothetical protein
MRKCPQGVRLDGGGLVLPIGSRRGLKAQRAAAHSVDTSELGAHQNNLRGVVDPYQQDDERCRGTEGRLQPLLTDVEPDPEFSDFEGLPSLRHRSRHRAIPMGRSYPQHRPKSY